MTTDTVASSSLLKNVTRYEDVKDAAKKTSEDMGKQDFLTLFTAQLQNQNPLEPVKNEAFVAQLAQFSQLEALTDMQTKARQKRGFCGSTGAGLSAGSPDQHADLAGHLRDLHVG